MILVTGAGGQIGGVLTKALQKRYGLDNILPTDIHDGQFDGHLFELLDITDYGRLLELVNQYKITQIYHLAAVLSARGESRPIPTWDINMRVCCMCWKSPEKVRWKRYFFRVL